MKSGRSLALVVTLCLALIVAALPFAPGCAQQPAAKPAEAPAAKPAEAEPAEAKPSEAKPAAPAGPAPASIKIGGVYSLTGADSSVGAQVEAGYKLAIEAINKDGGVEVKAYGKKIPLELVALDMESSAEKGIARAESLYAQHKVTAYVGTTFFAAAVHVAEKNKVPAVVVASAGQYVHERGYKYWFTPMGTSPDIARQVFDLLDSIPKAERPNKVVIFEEQSDWGIEMSEFWQKEIKSRGYDLVGIQKYTMVAKDLSPQILAAKAAGAELLLSNPIMPDGMTMMKQMKELAYKPKAAVVVRAPDDLPWGKALGPLGDYVIFTSGWQHSMPFPGVPELNAAHQAKFNRPADVMTGPAYASIQIIAEAIKKAGTLDTQKVRDALETTDMTTVVGPVKFRPDGTNAVPVAPVAQWQNGQQEVVWPDKLKTKPLVYPIP